MIEEYDLSSSAIAVILNKRAFAKVAKDMGQYVSKNGLLNYIKTLRVSNNLNYLSF